MIKNDRDPFAEYDHGLRRWFVAQTAPERMEMVSRFSRAQCRRALEVPHLQKIVADAIHRRLRKLQRGEK
jgi:hypothetical protein